jgi:hypothetical protein
MYDAILSQRTPLLANATDPDMEKFIPLLNDYLKSEYYFYLTPAPPDQLL